MNTMMKPVCALVILAGANFNAYADSRGEEAKKSFNTMMTKGEKVYQRFEKWPMFEKFSMKVEDYKMGEDTSTATITTVVATKKTEDRESVSQKGSAKATITHTQALLDKGIVARIETKADNIETEDEAIKKQVKLMSDKIKNVTDIYKNGKIHTYVSMAAYEADGVKMKGVKANWHGHLDTYEKMYGNFDGEIAGIEDGTTELKPFTFKGKYDDSGEFNFTTSPIAIEENQATIFEIKSMAVTGNLVNIDNLDFGLMNVAFTMNNMKISNSKKIPVPIAFKKLQLAFKSTSLKNGSVGLSLATHIAPEGDWVGLLTGDQFDFSKADISASVDNMPVEILNKFSGYVLKGMESTYTGEESEKVNEAIKKELENDIKKWADMSEKAGLGPSVHVDIESSQGKLLADLQAHLKPNDVDLEKAKGEELTPEFLLSLFDIKGKASLPASLVEAFGIQMMLAVAFEKKEDAYVTDIKTEENKLIINDVPFDLSQFSQ